MKWPAILMFSSKSVPFKFYRTTAGLAVVGLAVVYVWLAVVLQSSENEAKWEQPKVHT